MKLNKVKMAELAEKKETTVWAAIILAAPFVINLVLLLIRTTMFVSLQIKILLVPLLTTLAVIFLMSLVAQMLFHAKGDHIAFFRVLGHGSIIMVASIIPYILSILGVVDVMSIFNLINLAAGVWMLVVTYQVLMNYYKLNQQNAIVTIVLGIVGVFIINSILRRILLGPLYQYI